MEDSKSRAVETMPRSLFACGSDSRGASIGPASNPEQKNNFMEELVQIVATKTGISPDQARAAIEAVIQHLESKMSPAMAGVLNSVLNAEGQGGSSAVATEAEGMLKSFVGGFFNK